MHTILMLSVELWIGFSDLRNTIFFVKYRKTVNERQICNITQFILIARNYKFLQNFLQMKTIVLTFIFLSQLMQTPDGCTPSTCCDKTNSCGDSTCCNQCQTRCRTTTCLNNCRQDCCNESPCQNSNCYQKSGCSQNSNCFQSSCRQASTCFSNCQSRCSQDVDNCSDGCSRECCGEEGYYNGKCCSTTITNVVRTVGSGGARSGFDSNSDSNSYNNIINNSTTSINMNNTVNNENRIEVPIDIANSNVVNINVVPANDSNTYTEIDGVPSRQRDVEITPQTVPVPIPVPIPVPNPAPVHLSTQSPVPQSSCCNLVVPCVQQGCRNVHTVCGPQCTNRMMYAPVNPCQQGCSRRPYAFGNSCSMSGSCRRVLTDCSSCDMNSFHTTYQGYQQCNGCFYGSQQQSVSNNQLW